MNRILARAGRRVLLSGPEVAPAALKWVDYAVRHRNMPGFKSAVCATTEASAYALVVRDLLNSRLEADIYAD